MADSSTALTTRPGAPSPFAAPPQSATGSPGASPFSNINASSSLFGSHNPNGLPIVAGDPGIRSQAPGSTPTNPANNLLTPGNAENFYGDTSSQYKDPSYTEQLVSQGMGGQLNDYYQFGQNQLNSQYAAMGGGPSGSLLRASWFKYLLAGSSGY